MNGLGLRKLAIVGVCAGAVVGGLAFMVGRDVIWRRPQQCGELGCDIEVAVVWLAVLVVTAVVLSVGFVVRSSARLEWGWNLPIIVIGLAVPIGYALGLNLGVQGPAPNDSQPDVIDSSGQVAIMIDTPPFDSLTTVPGSCRFRLDSATGAREELVSITRPAFDAPDAMVHGWTLSGELTISGEFTGLSLELSTYTLNAPYFSRLDALTLTRDNGAGRAAFDALPQVGPVIVGSTGLEPSESPSIDPYAAGPASISGYFEWTCP